MHECIELPTCRSASEQHQNPKHDLSIIVERFPFRNTSATECDYRCASWATYSGAIQTKFDEAYSTEPVPLHAPCPLCVTCSVSCQLCPLTAQSPGGKLNVFKYAYVYEVLNVKLHIH